MSGVGGKSLNILDKCSPTNSVINGIYLAVASGQNQTRESRNDGIC